jgi:hypothetical protein
MVVVDGDDNDTMWINKVNLKNGFMNTSQLLLFLVT